MLTKLVVSILAFASLLALLAGCGSSSDDSSAAALTKSQFIAQGDQICQKAHQQRDEVFKQLLAENGNKPPLGKAEQEEVILTKILPPWETMTAELGELGVPSGEEEQAEAIVDGYQETVDTMREDPGSALETSGATSFAEADKLAKQFGFKVCPST